MKLLLFGGNGQLGTEIRLRLNDLHIEVAAPVSRELDVTNTEQVNFLARTFQPDVIVNSAAYTAVDLAEKEIENAYAINAHAPKSIALAAKEVGARMIHVSTDYVFDGMGDKPLTENAPTNPQSVYGKSKLAGEQAVQEVLSDNVAIIRTSSLHGSRGINFVSTMVKLLKEREELKVVADQVMSPTWAGWLAEVIIDIARLNVGGIYHASGTGAVSWYDFTSAIYERIKPHIKREQDIRLLKTTSKEFGRPAPRPAYSVFDCSKLTKTIGRAPIPWQQGLDAHLLEMGYPSE